MDRRFSRESNGFTSLQKKLAESRRPNREEPVPDLTDFMNDMFFGTINNDKKAYNFTGGGLMDDDEDYYGDSTRNSNSRLTQEWLREAKQMVASSPSRCESPSRLVGSPRFAAAQGRDSASLLDRRNPLSRSARRHRAAEGFSGEILSKSAEHSRSKSESVGAAAIPSEVSPASAVQKWFSNILKPSNPAPPSSNLPNPTPQTLPPRLSVNRKSRFQDDSSGPHSLPIPAAAAQSKRTFKAPAAPDTHLLSPPKNLIESARRRSISSSTCSLPENPVLSPPRNLVESAHRRSISSSTCSIDKLSSKVNSAGGHRGGDEARNINEFLKEQRTKIGKIVNGEISAKAKILLSGPSNKDDEEECVVVPVMNVKRGNMWKLLRAAWLFHHISIDATSLLFSDEVDLENLMMAKQLSILVVGQDVLRTNGEVGSQCTILTDNYCEDAYDLLQTPVLKNLLLAGILLDTRNLNASAKLSMARDAEAVQLLLVGSAPNHRNTLFDQLMQDQRDNSFFEALRHNYGKPPNENGRDSGVLVEHTVLERKSTSISNEAITQNAYRNSNDVKSAKPSRVSPKSAKPKSSTVQAPTVAPAEAAPNSSGGKNKFFLAKWFGFGSK
ncbi:hypothetical protein AAG906_000602 [Vitis piasezkii]